MNNHYLSLALGMIGASALFAAPMPEKAELLASNTVVAQYMGTQERPCYFRTALCPDRCDHAAKVANFVVLVNENYSKPGKYGDDKAEVGSVIMIDMKNDIPGQDEAVNKLIETLQPGDTVRLTQDHYYGEIGCCMTPFRPVTKMEKAEKPDNAPEVPAEQPEQHPVMPIMPRVR